MPYIEEVIKDDPTPTEETTSTSKIGGTRLDKFLAKIAGEEVDITPKTETERRLNEIAQNGSSGGIFVVSSSQEGVLDKTWQEIYDAARTQIVVLIFEENLGVGELAVIQGRLVTVANTKAFFVVFEVNDDSRYFNAQSENDYPVMRDPS